MQAALHVLDVHLIYNKWKVVIIAYSLCCYIEGIYRDLRNIVALLLRSQWNTLSLNNETVTWARESFQSGTIYQIYNAQKYILESAEKMGLKTQPVCQLLKSYGP